MAKQQFKPQEFQVKLEVETHYSPDKDAVCNEQTHDDCNWEKILKEGLVGLYPELHIHGEPIAQGNIIDFKISLTNRSNTIPADIESKIDEYIGVDNQLVVKSLNVQ